MRTPKLLFVLTGIFCLCATTQAAVVERSISELTAEAQQIVIGDVIDVYSFWNAEHDMIRSQITIEVSDYLMGTGDGIEVLEMSGGTVDDVTLMVSVLPIFELGDHVLLFLGDNEIRLVESFQGAFLTDGLSIIQMAPACQRTIPETLESLSGFLDKVAQALPEGVKLPDLQPYEGGFIIPTGAVDYELCGYSWAYQANPMGEDIKINANCADSSAGTAEEQRTQILNGANAWNNAGAEFAFTYGGTSTQTAVGSNGTNLIYFDTTPPDGGGYIAATYIWHNGANVTENDMVFNDAEYTWWNGSGTCFNKMDIWNIATHEFGHYLCLADLYGGSDSAKTMYGYGDYCDTHARDLHQDDVNGIIAIYGSGGSTGYCAATSNSTSYEYISRFQLGTINNSTSSSGYADYTAISTNLDIGTGYTATVTIGTAYSSDIGGLWIDWNHDEDFGDSGETITTGWSGSGPYSVTITPPAGALTGTTRLRVRIQDGDYDPSLSPCGTTSYGEVEDYTVSVSSPCVTPTFLQQPTPTQYICQGSAAILSVQVDIPSPQYQWRRGTTNLVNDGSHIFGATGYQLVIVNFGSSDSATNYNCVVTNPNGNCSATSNNAALLNDSNVPSITGQPASQAATEGDYVTLHVGVSNPVLYNFQWRYNNVALTNGGRFSGVTSDTMAIYPVALTDGGAYDCVITGKTGAFCSTTTDDAVLTVNPAPDCPGDLNGDNVVNISDLSQLLAYYGTASGATPEQGDMDGDGDVDISDLSALLAIYGTTC